MSSIFSKVLCNKLAEFTSKEITRVKLIVNDVSKETTIAKKEVVNESLQLYVNLSLQPDDILNGIELYNQDGVLLAKTQINLNYSIQQATYLFVIDFYSDNLIGGK